MHTKAHTKSNILYLSIIGKIASWTMLSRVLGFVRDMLFANLYGASYVLDAFLVAFKVPNFMRRFFSEGAMTQSFVPIYVKEMHQREKSKALVTQCLVLLSVFLMIISTLVVCYPSAIIKLFAYGFIHDPQRMTLACQMIRWTFPFLLMIANVTLLSGVLNSHQSFGLPAALPVLQNTCFIMGTYIGSSYFTNGMNLAISIPLAGLIELMVIYFACRTYIGPIGQWQWSTLKKIFTAMGIIIGGAIFTQFNIVADTMFASFLNRGSISWLYYADRLINLPIGVIAVSISTLLLPQFSSAIGRNDKETVANLTLWGIKVALASCVPCIIFLCFFGEQALILLFYHGAFSAKDIHMTYLALFAMSIGLPGFMLNKVFNTLFYAHQVVKTPTYIACISAVFAIAMNIVMIPYLGHVALALTLSIVALLQCIILCYLAHKQSWFDISIADFKLWSVAFLLLLIFAALLKTLSPQLSWWLNAHILMRLQSIVILGGLIVLVYVALLKKMGLLSELKS